MTINEIVALSVMLLSGTNVALYGRLSSVMNGRFDSVERKFETNFENVDRKFESVERRLETIQGSLHEMDVRLTKLEPK